MAQRTILHFIDSSSRHRAEFARLGFILGYHCEVYNDTVEVGLHPPRDGVILARDVRDDGGIAGTIARLNQLGVWLPLIAIEEAPQLDRIVEAIRAGALDYLALPLDPDKLAECLARIQGEIEMQGEARRRMIEARDLIAKLSRREREVLDWLTEGSSNKAIARELQISPRTVEIHRANMMTKLGASHPAEVVRLRLEAKIDDQ